MKFVLTLSLWAFFGLASGKTLFPSTGFQRTHGNFGPQIKKSFEIRPPALFQSSLVNNDRVFVAKLYSSLRIGIPLASLRVTNSHTNSRNTVTHVYIQQVLNGIDVANGVGNVNVGPSGEVLSVGNSFFTGTAPSADFKNFVKISPSEAVTAFANFLKLGSSSSDLSTVLGTSNSITSFMVSGAPFAVSPIPADLKYMQLGEGETIALVWSLQVEMRDNMYNAFVDAVTGGVVSLIDWVSDATYNVYPFGVNDPESGDRALTEDFPHADASPLGWHSQGEDKDFTNTIGNNVYAQSNPDGGTDFLDNDRPDGSEAITFDFPVDFTGGPENYLEAATTNLFYWNNVVHDLFYVYGFDETAGNFQENNLGQGGKDKDAVVAFAQDGSGYNNANFLTPPDGLHGCMRMFIWNLSDPSRDSDLDSGIVTHEYCHGLSTRLTGGPANSNCLVWGEHGGMGEGWGDFVATILRTTENSTRDDSFPIGEYTYNNVNGIRTYLYSTNLNVNPETYSYLGHAGYSEVHAIGQVWASLLYEVYWNLVEKHGFDPDWFNADPSNLKTDASFVNLRTGQKQVRSKKQAGLGGNVIILQLLIDGMKLQPCNPTFIEARDAILQADEVNNNGDNRCTIWKGFAKRGLGVDAKYEGNFWAWKGTEDFKLPEDCAQACRV